MRSMKKKEEKLGLRFASNNLQEFLRKEMETEELLHLLHFATLFSVRSVKRKQPFHTVLSLQTNLT